MVATLSRSASREKVISGQNRIAALLQGLKILTGPTVAGSLLVSSGSISVISGKNASYLAANAVLRDDGNWDRVDITAAAHVLGLASNGTLTEYIAPAGANPITTWATTRVLDDGSGILSAALARPASFVGQYIALPTFSTTVVGSWVKTPLVYTITHHGAAWLAIGAIQLQHSAAAANALVAIGYDNAPVATIAYAYMAAAGQPLTVPIVWPIAITAFTAGTSHTVEVWVNLSTAGTLSIYTGAYSMLNLFELNA